MFTQEEKDIIVQLKQNWKIFGGCSKEEQEVFKKVGKKNCLCSSAHKEPIHWYNASGSWDWGLGICYRIKPDFLPEPQPKDYEINLCADRYCIDKILPCSISEVVTMPGFRGFYCKEDKSPVHQDAVVLHIERLHHTVVARFEE